MLSATYAMARWVEVGAAALAVLAVIATLWWLRTTTRPSIGRGIIALVVAGGLCLGAYEFLGTRVVQVKLNSIKEIGLELRHEGLRTNALVYQISTSVPYTLRVLPSGTSGSGILNRVSGYLVHKTTTVSTQIAVYGLIDFTTVQATVASVDRAAHTVTVALPTPQVGSNTTYVSSVNGITERDGPLTAIAQAVAGIVSSVVGRPGVSVAPGAALAKAEAVALGKAQRSAVLRTCGEEEIAAQLAGIFHLIPAYHDYTVVVHWPVPPDPALNCAAMQRKPASSGG